MAEVDSCFLIKPGAVGIGAAVRDAASHLAQPLRIRFRAMLGAVNNKPCYAAHFRLRCALLTNIEGERTWQLPHHRVIRNLFWNNLSRALSTELRGESLMDSIIRANLRIGNA